LLAERLHALAVAGVLPAFGRLLQLSGRELLSCSRAWVWRATRSVHSRPASARSA
jgi:hypothetical protein